MYIEIDAHNRSLQGSMDRHIEEARRDENLLATAMAHEHIINLKGQVADLTKQLEELGEEVAKSSQWAFAAESQQDEALAQLSVLEETHRQRDEA